MTKGDVREYDVILRGDNQVQNVEFFVVPGKTGIVKVNNVVEFRQTQQLGIYQKISFNIEIEGIAVGETQVAIGFRYIGAQSGTVGFEQVVQDTFSVIVKNVTQSTNTTTNTTPVIHRTTGGGGGGGGGIILAVNQTKNTTKVPDVVSLVNKQSEQNAPEEVGGVVGSVVGAPIVQQESSEVNSSQKSVSAVASVISKIASKPGGILIMSIMVILIVSLVLGMKVVSIVRRDEA
jgi:hypothetical protein